MKRVEFDLDKHFIQHAGILLKYVTATMITLEGNCLSWSVHQRLARGQLQDTWWGVSDNQIAAATSGTNNKLVHGWAWLDFLTSRVQESDVWHVELTSEAVGVSFHEPENQSTSTVADIRPAPNAGVMTHSFHFSEVVGSPRALSSSAAEQRGSLLFPESELMWSSTKVHAPV